MISQQLDMLERKMADESISSERISMERIGKRFVHNAQATIITTMLKNRMKESSEESSSDEEWEAAVKKKRTRRKRVQPHVHNISEPVMAPCQDHEFNSHFRLSHKTFELLLNKIGRDLLRKVRGCETIPSRQQLQIAIWKMANPDSYRSLCERFKIAASTALHSVRRVCAALNRLAPTMIKWPTGDAVGIAMRGFEEASSFPRTIGAVGVMHLSIDTPNENPENYVNHTGHHSIQLQVVCDHRALITHCYAGQPGAIDEQTVFRLSEVTAFLSDPDKFPEDSHLVGNATYELHHHFMVPFEDNGQLTERQKNFNFCQALARNAVERCFSLLKDRMRSLMHCLPMKTVDFMAEYIVACCVLHNICVLKNDELEMLIADNVQNEGAAKTSNHGNIEAGDANVNIGIYKRDVIAQILPVKLA